MSKFRTKFDRWQRIDFLTPAWMIAVSLMGLALIYSALRGGQ